MAANGQGVTALAAVPLFKRLRRDQIVAIQGVSVMATLRPGEIVVRQGQTGQALYVILTGAVETRTTAPDAPQPRIGRLKPGEYFGETAVMEPAQSPFTAVVAEPTQLLVLTQIQLVDAMRRDPELAIAIARQATVLSRGHHASAEAEELGRLRAQMLMYAEDLKKVYDEERERATQLREALMDTIRVLINGIESKDPRQVGHGSRVARYAQLLAREIGWNEEQSVRAGIGGLIHDIGQMSLPDELARKKGPLTRAEIAEMRQHPELGARLIRGIRSLEPLLPYVLYHHENWDGTGYPERLRGQDIPIEARLVAVADAFDELRAVLPPNDPNATESAIRDLRRLSGDRLDPDLLAAFVAAHRAGRLAA